MNLSGSIVALVTPFRENSIDFQALRTLIDWHILSGTQGIVICGSTGEGVLLTEKEREDIIRIAVDEGKGRIPIIVGCGHASTQGTLAQVLQAENLKADGVLLVSPYYAKPTSEGLYNHFKQIHDQTTLPIILYNNPSRCSIEIPVKLVVKLSQLERIIALKDSTQDLTRPSQLRCQIQKEFFLLSGDDLTTPSYLAQGGNGVISVAANIIPSLFQEMIHFWHKEDFHSFSFSYQKALPLMLSLCQETNPIPIKSALSLLGKCENILRSPLTPATPKTEEKIKEALLTLGLPFSQK